MPTKALIADAKQRMHASVETVRRELAAMRTGRASLAMLDGIARRLLRHAHAAQPGRQPVDPGPHPHHHPALGRRRSWPRSRRPSAPPTST